MNHPDIDRIERRADEKYHEIWKDISGYEGIFQISSIGRVKSLPRTITTKTGAKRKVKGCIKVGFLHEAGYPLTVLKVNGKSKIIRNHREVAKAFIPNPNGLPLINHKNGIKDDNRVENLEWCDMKYNARHAIEVLGKHGNHPEKPRGTTYNKKVKKWVASLNFRSETYYLGYHSRKSDGYKAYFEKFKELMGYEPWCLTKYPTHER